MQTEQQVSVWFPDAEILKKIRQVAKDSNRGIGYVICEKWREYENTNMSDLQKKDG